MNRFLFVYGALGHGGLETLILRLANHLARQGRPVAVCVSDGPLIDQLHEGVDLLVWYDQQHAARIANQWIGRSYESVTMVSFDPISAALGLAIEISNRSRVPLTHINGVYHPRSFFMRGERRDRIAVVRLLAKAIGDPLIYYMNDESRSAHEEQWGVTLADSPIIPVPVANQAIAWRGVEKDSLRIVSVGRLVDFKAYNLAVAEIVREFHDQGLEISWDIYGTGPLESAIRETIDKNDVGDSVQLRGTLPYERFNEVVATFDLFVGIGTAALEAAMLGVPTIAATDSQPRLSYGFFNQLPFGNLGETQSFAPPHDVGDLIRRYAATGADEKHKLSVSCRAAATRYGIDAFFEQVDHFVARVQKSPSRAFKRLALCSYNAVTAGPLARIGRRALAVIRR